MAKIIYNACYGGFSLSERAIQLGRELSDNAEWGSWSRDIPRHDRTLVVVVEMLGDDANGGYADLAIREIPDGSLYRVEEYDGNEHVVLPSELKWEVAP